jgi:hypothetical protein
LNCPICEKRKPKRYCPAKGEKICAVCCGMEREVTIDCPSDCPHLIQARRWEQAHPREFAREEILFADVEVPQHVVRERQQVVSGLGFTVLKFAKENAALADADVLDAVAPLADAYRTLGSGIYYENPPQGPLAGGLYAALAAFWEEVKKQEAERAGFPSIKDSEIYLLLVFLWRVGKMRSNGRPKSRAFLDFLRAQYPASAEIEKEAPRIVMP